MSDEIIESLIRNSLDLGPEWQIDRFTLDTKYHRVDVYLRHSGENLVCPETGEPATLYGFTKERSWRHLDWCQSKSYIHCRVSRVKSSKGIKTVEILWAEPSSRFTYAFENSPQFLIYKMKNQTESACDPTDD